MYLGMDGSGVPVRPAEVEGRRGKQPDGSAKTREVKLATLWTAEGRDKQGRPVRDLGSVSYSSGVVEAGCKQIGDRLKRAGMRWTVAGANAIIALRCCILSGRFDDFWERRAKDAA